MSVHIENLRPGDWITGCEDKTGCPYFPPMQFDGMPWKVVGVSAPFVACQADGVLVTIDLRRCGVTKLDKRYVKAVRRFVGAPRAACVHQAERDPRDCPRCGQRMVQRIPDADLGRRWHRTCPDCGYDQGPVEEGAIP